MSVVLVLFLNYLALRKLRWYYKIAFVLYIPLLIFWFIPKIVLQKGKFYLFISYVSGVFNRFKKWRSTLIHMFLTLLIIFLLSNVEGNIVRVFAALFATYVFVRYNFNYTKKSIRPASFFSEKLKSQLEEKENGKDKAMEQLQKMADNVGKKKMKKKVRKLKQMENVMTYYSFMSSFREEISSTRGKSSFILYWVFTFAFSLLLSLVLITFINYQIYLIDSNSFQTIGEVNFGEFIRYTFKCVTYGDIDEIKPNSSLTKIIEALTFIFIGILYLIIIVSFGYALRNSKIQEETNLVINYIDRNLQFTEEFTKKKFKKEVSVIIMEVSSIKKSYEEIKNLLNKLF